MGGHSSLGSQVGNTDTTINRIMVRLLLIAAACVVAVHAKEQKAFSLFSVVTFKNEDCQSQDNTAMNGPRNGTCYTSTECSDKGGKQSGSCASGFGVCCLFTKETCGDDINQNQTYIRNEDFPTALSGASLSACSFTVNKCDSEICRVRLDFEQFTILGPASTASLDTVAACIDSFEVSGLTTGNTVPKICGENMGQHMYFEIGSGASDNADLKFTFGAVAGSRTFEIKVTQYSCSSDVTPPEGCLQWHTGTEGRLETFNFQAGEGGFHLSDQQYSICIRQEAGMCCTEYSVCSDTNSMTLGMQAATAVQGSLCTLDYVEIEGSSGTCGGRALLNRYCGQKLGFDGAATIDTNICDCTAPFRVGITTDSVATDDGTPMAGMNRGVCLEYTQKPC